MKQIFFLCLLTVFFYVVSPIYAQSSSFVSRQGTQLYYQNKLFRFVGANRYNLLTIGGYPYRGCGGAWTETDLDSYFAEMKSAHIQVIRFWAFQSFTEGGTDFGRLDYLISLSAKYGVLLLPVFENHWSDCTTGGTKTASWYSSGYTSSYGSPKTLKEYISLLVNRYKNSPQILMWQIMNEAESSDGQALVTFADDVGRFIKSIDSNHLVSFGTLGSNQQGMQLYQQIHSSPGIDVLEYHDYDYDCCGTIYPLTLDTRINQAKTLNKPIFVGEAGIRVGCSGCVSTSTRATIFQQKITDFFTKGGSGYLIWSYRDNVFNQSTDVMGFALADPLTGVLGNYATAVIPTGVGTKPADANGDGVVNGLDYIAWLTHFNQHITGKQNGEFNGDGVVNGLDYIAWLTGFGK